MPDTLKLFISYRSSDASKVDKIAGDLARLTHDDGTPRYKPWQDKHNLPPASPHWWDAIVDAIGDCQVFVFHISQASLSSVVCQAELDYAHRRNRPIVPIVLDGEFILLDSGKYDLPKETWALVPKWLGERQFLFYTGADFPRQFEMALDGLRRAWPQDVYAARPMNPTPNSDQTTNNTLYDQACDYAERMAFTQAEEHFDVLVRRNDRRYGKAAAEWLELLRRYAELIEVDALPRARFTFKPLWAEYTALFPKDFLNGLFDPKGFATRGTPAPQTPVVSAAPPPAPAVGTRPAVSDAPPPPPKALTAAEYFNRGYDFQIAGDYDRALTNYSEAIRLNPKESKAYHGRGVSYNAKGDYDRAIADYTEAIRLNPKDADAYNNRGSSYHNGKKDYDRAIADYTEAIRLNPQYAAAYVNRGVSYKAKGDIDRAIADYNEAIRLNPQYADAYYNRGNSYNDGKKEYDRAIADFTEAIRLNPQYADAYLGRGNSYQNKGNHDRAIADYTEAIRLNPMDAAAYVNRGISYAAKGDYDRAIADATETIRLNPQHANAYVSRGSSYDDKKEYDRAIADYNEAIRLNPQNANAYVNRGVSYRKKGDYDRAIADYDMALRIDPNVANAANNRQLAMAAKKTSGR